MLVANGKNLKYRVIAKIDEGSFGDVFQVNKNNGEVFAMKQVLYRGDPMQDPYVQAEIKNLSLICHKRVIRLYDVLFTPRAVNFILEYAENGNMEIFLTNNFPLPEKLLWKFCYQITEAVNVCHSLSVAHKDINPANILVTNSNDVKLADFGLSVNMSKSGTNQILCMDYTGHVSYMAPEVLKENPYNPFWSDAWSLGTVLYFLLNNRPLFNGYQEHVIGQQNDLLTSGVLRLLGVRLNDVEESVLCVVQKLLVVPPEARSTLPAVLNKLTKYRSKTTDSKHECLP